MYTIDLRRKLKEKGYEIITGTPLDTLMLFLSKEVDAALISSAAAFSLGLEPVFRAPIVMSKGIVENVVLLIRKREKKIKLWRTPHSFTGLAVALWYLEQDGNDIEIVDDRKNADVILLIGDEARRLSRSFKGKVVDLGKVWYQRFGMPLIYALTVSWRIMDLEIEPYRWRHIDVSILDDEVYRYLELQNKVLRHYWVRPFILPKGLLGMLLRSA